ncbi:thioredoxin family protein [Cryptosporidium andersoni]|uniref:Thioredoxin family protein n=1 Tax=Cryptosporidium andersoni TaxID=117008 RepID=A0A1J4MWU0_9CRYT|nr:thioredoxin family protein [Cryptosporidium andersoni]
MKYLYKGLYILVLFFILVFSFVNCDSEKAVELFELNSKNFNEFIYGFDHSLVIFYSLECPVCITMIDSFTKLLDKLRERDVMVGKINGEENLILLEKYQIQDYPTIKFFRKTRAEEYFGGKEIHEILQWVDNQISYPVTIINNSTFLSKQNIEELTEMHGIIYIMHGILNSSRFDNYIKVADFNRVSGKFYFIPSNTINTTILDIVNAVNDTSFNNTNLYNKEDLSEWLLCLRQYESKVYIYDGTFDLQSDIESFIRAHNIPLFGEISGKNYIKYADVQYDLIWLLVPMDKDKAIQSIQPYIKMFVELAKEFEDEYRVVWLDTAEHSMHLNTVLLVEPEMLPTVAIAKSRPYILPPNTVIDLATIRQFIIDVNDGKVEPKLRSEPIPSYNKTNGNQNSDLIKLVGNNFSSMVLDDEENDWLVILITPFCQPCTDTEKLLKKIKSAIISTNKSPINFGFIDISENDLPKDDFYSKSIPSIFFIKARQKTPIHFTNDKVSYLNIKKFILDSTSNDKDSIKFSDPPNVNNLVVTLFPDFEQFGDLDMFGSELSDLENTNFKEENIKDEL